MMGLLVNGRYGPNEASPLPLGKGWVRRVWNNLFAHKPARPR